MKRKAGKYQIIGNLEHFIPDPLPPKNPDLQLSPEIMDVYGKTMLEIGKLNQIAQSVPNIAQFIKAYILKEAMLSSAIENINTTLVDVFTQVLEQETPSKETQLVMNYIDALSFAAQEIQEKNVRLSSQLLLQAHKILMGVDLNATPGYFRMQSVRVGYLIPAPAQDVEQLMTELESFIHLDSSLPALIKAGLAHVQFETIHPFLDGNGRIGRLLIVLQLLQDKVLAAPLLYPSLDFKSERFSYYMFLDAVRTHGDFEGWIRFYLQVMYAGVVDARERIDSILKFKQNIIDLVIKKDEYTRMQSDLLQLLDLLFAYPIITITKVSQELDIAYNTARNVVLIFEKSGVLVQMTEQKRNKYYAFTGYLDILEDNSSVWED